MIKSKTHLENINRVNLDNLRRNEYLRLDKNEGLILPITKETFLNIMEDEYNKLTMYPEYGELKNKLAKHLNLDYKNIHIGNGSDAIIKNIFDTYVKPYDKILITNPTFGMYPIYGRMYETQQKVVDYTSCSSFPKDSFLEALQQDVKLAVIVSPNNPTGHTLDKLSLKHIIEKAHKNNILVIIDEAYFSYNYDSIISSVNKYNNLIVLRTFSKFFGLPSLRIGYVASCYSIINNLRATQLTFDVNSIGVIVANNILDSKTCIKELVSKYNDGKEYILSKLKEQGIKTHTTDTNFILIDCGKHADKIKDALYTHNILVGAGFKQDILKKYIRVTIGEKEQMEHFWKEFKHIYGEVDGNI